MKNKFILDVTCGGRTIWFNKNHPASLYCDKRREEKGFEPARPTFAVQPDKIIDFRNLEFADRSFKLVVFDPPHMKEGKAGNGIFKRKYGSLNKETWAADLKKGFDECFRVLEDYGILIFKWSSVQIKIKDVLEIFDKQPLFGHPTGKQGNTMWMCFMKIPEALK